MTSHCTKMTYWTAATAAPWAAIAVNDPTTNPPLFFPRRQHRLAETTSQQQPTHSDPRKRIPVERLCFTSAKHRRLWITGIPSKYLPLSSRCRKKAPSRWTSSPRATRTPVSEVRIPRWWAVGTNGNLVASPMGSRRWHHHQSRLRIIPSKPNRRWSPQLTVESVDQGNLYLTLHCHQRGRRPRRMAPSFTSRTRVRIILIRVTGAPSATASVVLLPARSTIPRDIPLQLPTIVNISTMTSRKSRR